MKPAARAVGLFLAVAGIAALLPLGCRSVLGIHEVGSDQLTCDLYCDTIAQGCSTPGKLQYASRDACMGLCATFPVGTVADTTGNTLGCRLNLASHIADVDEGNCDQAGPGGGGMCGDDCTSFCTGALQVCPSDFTSMDDCAMQCAALPDATCAPYSVDPNVSTPDTFSVQCRLFHLTAATLEPAVHCPHVMGLVYCNKDSPPCPTDGGTEGGG